MELAVDSVAVSAAATVVLMSATVMVASETVVVVVDASAAHLAFEDDSNTPPTERGRQG